MEIYRSILGIAMISVLLGLMRIIFMCIIHWGILRLVSLPKRAGSPVVCLVWGASDLELHVDVQLK